MMPRVDRHLSDDALQRLRRERGISIESRRHLAACELCRELDEAWKEFDTYVRRAGFEPLEEKELLPNAYYDAGYVDDLSLCKLKQADLDLPDLQFAKPVVPEDWIDDTLGMLEQRNRPVREAGRLRVVEDADGNVILQAEPTEGGKQAITAPRRDRPGWPERAFPFNEVVLHVGARRAGFRLFLIVRATSPDGAMPAGWGEATLVPEGGGVQTRPLGKHGETAGLAWFRLPPGASTLFVHMGETARIRIDRPVDSTREPMEPR